MNNGLTIVIPTINNEKVLQPLIDSIARQDFELPMEVLIVNNNSLNLIDVHNRELSIKYIKCDPGVNKARNTGLECAQYEIILFLDDDCRLAHLKTLCTHFERHRTEPELFAVGGGYSVLDHANYYSRLYNRIQMNWLYSNYFDATTNDSHCLIGGHFSIKKSKAEKNQLKFDETIHYGGSEVSFFRKAYVLNLKMRLFDFRIIHDTHETFISLTKKIHKQGKHHFSLRNENLRINFKTDSADYATIDYKTRRSIVELFLINYFNTIYWWSAYQHNNQYSMFFKHIFHDTKFKLLKKQDRLRAMLLRALNKT